MLILSLLCLALRIEPLLSLLRIHLFLLLSLMILWSKKYLDYRYVLFYAYELGGIVWGCGVKRTVTTLLFVGGPTFPLLRREGRFFFKSGGAYL